MRLLILSLTFVLAATAGFENVATADQLIVPIGVNTFGGGPVLSFDIPAVGALVPAATIPPAQVNDPISAAFGRGYLFVGNRWGNVGGGAGSISYFTPQTDGSFSYLGQVTGNSLEAVHGVAISPNGELFAANLFGDVSRFTLAPDGTPIANGVISHPGQTLGVAVSTSGELFVTSNTDVQRFLFDGLGNAIPNGSFPVPGFAHFPTFSPWGELFVAEGGGTASGSVQRFIFDSGGNAIPNGSIPLPVGAIGVAFDLSGKLFVSSQARVFNGGGVYQFHFDGAYNAIFDQYTPVDRAGGVAVVPEPSTFVLGILGALSLIGFGRRFRRQRLAALAP